MSEENKKEKVSFPEVEIVPTVMPISYGDFIEKIGRVAPFVKTIQIDVMDGSFVPSTSWPYSATRDGKPDADWLKLVNQEAGLPHWEEVDFEIDLMVANQIAEAENWISAGVMRVIGHVEALKPEDSEKFLALKKLGVELSLALVPETPNSALDLYLDKLDSVQFMGINKIGFQGQEFEPKVLEKISELHARKPDLPISIDGGVSFETAKLLVKAGVRRLASGSVVFNADNAERIINDLKNTANNS